MHGIDTIIVHPYAWRSSSRSNERFQHQIRRRVNGSRNVLHRPSGSERTGRSRADRLRRLGERCRVRRQHRVSRTWRQTDREYLIMTDPRLSLIGFGFQLNSKSNAVPFVRTFQVTNRPLASFLFSLRKPQDGRSHLSRRIWSAPGLHQCRALHWRYRHEPNRSWIHASGIVPHTGRLRRHQGVGYSHDSHQRRFQEYSRCTHQGPHGQRCASFLI